MEQTPATSTVILVHGLWLKGPALGLQRFRTARCGFDARTFSYASMRSTLAENARALAAFISPLSASQVHLAGHSLGGLVILTMLASDPDRRIGRVVLMGTPAASCHAASRLGEMKLGRKLLGNCMPPQFVPFAVTDDREVGVIAGSRSFGLGRLIRGVPQPNDGVVAVSETLLAGMRDQIVLRVSHTQMLISSAVARQICAFLKQGRFLHQGGPFV